MEFQIKNLLKLQVGYVIENINFKKKNRIFYPVLTGGFRSPEFA